MAPRGRRRHTPKPENIFVVGDGVSTRGTMCTRGSTSNAVRPPEARGQSKQTQKLLSYPIPLLSCTNLFMSFPFSPGRVSRPTRIFDRHFSSRGSHPNRVLFPPPPRVCSRTLGTGTQSEPPDTGPWYTVSLVHTNLWSSDTLRLSFLGLKESDVGGERRWWTRVRV